MLQRSALSLSACVAATLVSSACSNTAVSLDTAAIVTTGKIAWADAMYRCLPMDAIDTIRHMSYEAACLHHYTI